MATPTPAIRGPGGFLAERRMRLTLGIAVIEGILVVAEVIPEWAVFVVAIAAVGYWLVWGRNYQSPMVRQASWIFAASQALVLLVPLLFAFVKTLAYVVLAVLAVVAVIFLFTEREHQPNN
jgi:hypothetical protein